MGAILNKVADIFAGVVTIPENPMTPQYPILLLRRISETLIPSPVSWNPHPHISRSLRSSGEADSEVHLHTDKPPSNIIFIRAGDRKLPEDGLTLLGMVGMKDPCPGVRTAMDPCRRVVVAVKMIIGDNLHTARALRQNAASSELIKT
ncbi:hypothetical protein ACLOJK_005936 [Asimina triloba]